MSTVKEKTKTHRSLWPLAVAIIWIATTLAGLAILWKYSNTPGSTSHPPLKWPSNVRLERSANGPTLVMFLHPHCPCSRATVGELERIAAKTQEHPLSPWIVFYKPTTAEQGWEQTDLWRAAEAIPGAQVVLDDNGELAKQFNAAISGETMLYDENGKLVFHGGITEGRGHAGDNTGENAIVDFVNQGTLDVPHTPVFGCPIIDLPQTK